MDAVLDSLTGLIEFRDVQISPDGKRVAWVEAVPGKAGPLPDRSVIQVAALGAEELANGVRRRRYFALIA